MPLLALLVHGVGWAAALAGAYVWCLAIGQIIARYFRADDDGLLAGCMLATGAGGYGATLARWAAGLTPLAPALPESVALGCALATGAAVFVQRWALERRRARRRGVVARTPARRWRRRTDRV